MQRLLLAICAAVLTATGIGMLLLGNGAYSGFDGALVKSGLVLAALAIALPQVKRLLQFAPPLFLACLLLGLLVVLKWPKAIVGVVPLLIAAWFLAPRSKTLPTPRQSKPKPRAAGRRK